MVMKFECNNFCNNFWLQLFDNGHQAKNKAGACRQGKLEENFEKKAKASS